MEMNDSEFSYAETIIEKAYGEQSSMVMNRIQSVYTDEDRRSLARLNELHRKGYLTENEYVRKLTGILHDREIKKREL